jgi:hypothetical protein
VRHDNVVPFDPARRGGLARRGAPDKSGELADQSLVMECPACASELRLEAAWIEGRDEVLCGKCDSDSEQPAARASRRERGSRL